MDRIKIPIKTETREPKTPAEALSFYRSSRSSWADSPFAQSLVIICAILDGHGAVRNRTDEGVRHRDYPAFTVQYHPDAAPGPHDGLHLFDEFMELMDAWKEQN